jgi:hypothetical protein
MYYSDPLFNLIADLDENTTYGSRNHRRMVSYLYLLTISFCSHKSFADLDVVYRYCVEDATIAKKDFCKSYTAAFVVFGAAVNVAQRALREVPVDKKDQKNKAFALLSLIYPEIMFL